MKLKETGLGQYGLMLVTIESLQILFMNFDLHILIQAIASSKTSGYISIDNPKVIAKLKQ